MATQYSSRASRRLDHIGGDGLNRRSAGFPGRRGNGSQALSAKHREVGLVEELHPEFAAQCFVGQRRMCQMHDPRSVPKTPLETHTQSLTTASDGTAPSLSREPPLEASARIPPEHAVTTCAGASGMRQTVNPAPAQFGQ